MRKFGSVAAAFVIAAAASGLGMASAFGSNHREPPKIVTEPTAENTDVYAFVAPEAPGQLNIIANWLPLQNPAGGPYFGKLDPEARYYVKIDNTGDGVEDVSYRWQFKNRFRNPNSVQYAVPPVESATDPNLNFVQSYDLYYETYRNGIQRSSRKIASNVPVAPDNVGPKTMPNYEQVSNSAIRNLSAGRKSFVGPVDDPFFVDLGAVFDGVNIDKPGRPMIGLGNQGGGMDDVSGFAVLSFALQVPASDVARDGRDVGSASAPNAVVGVWATTEYQAVTIGHDGDDHTVEESWQQVSRVGNPLINEVLVPISQKDKFNRTSPADDARNFGRFVVNPEPAVTLNALFKLGIKETDRTDIVQALLTGIPGLTQISPNAVPADTLKINLGVAPTANPNRLGALAGDSQGFPNGRRLADDVTDIELRVIAGALLSADDGGKQIPLGDGIDLNDKPFRSTFPYVALPNGSLDAAYGRVEPAHAPMPQPPA